MGALGESKVSVTPKTSLEAMDLVGLCAGTAKHGRRISIKNFVCDLGGVGFDPWLKAEVRGHHEYSRESENSYLARRGTSTTTESPKNTRRRCAGPAPRRRARCTLLRRRGPAAVPHDCFALVIKQNATGCC
jgi:hypothetical protein